MEGKKVVKIVASVFAGIIILCILFYFVIDIPVHNYIDTHTWAKITVIAAVDSDTSDVFIDTVEYLKGDTINAPGPVTLLIEDITHEGVVSFSVIRGSLYDDNGEMITSFTISEREEVHYEIENGTLSISVDSSRYQ